MNELQRIAMQTAKDRRLCCIFVARACPALFLEKLFKVSLSRSWPFKLRLKDYCGVIFPLDLLWREVPVCKRVKLSTLQVPARARA